MSITSVLHIFIITPLHSWHWCCCRCTPSKYWVPLWFTNFPHLCCSSVLKTGWSMLEQIKRDDSHKKFSITSLGTAFNFSYVHHRDWGLRPSHNSFLRIAFRHLNRIWVFVVNAIGCYHGLDCLQDVGDFLAVDS